MRKGKYGCTEIRRLGQPDRTLNIFCGLLKIHTTLINLCFNINGIKSTLFPPKPENKVSNVTFKWIQYDIVDQLVKDKYIR